MKYRLALPGDLGLWLEVAKDVGPIMRNPNMDADPIFLSYARRKLEQNDAMMASDEETGQYAGFIGFSRHNNSITWLGVKAGYRNMGIGSALLECALDNLDRGREITVNTYPNGYPPGQPARRLYFRHGFAEMTGVPFYVDGYEMVELSLLPAHD